MPTFCIHNILSTTGVPASQQQFFSWKFLYCFFFTFIPKVSNPCRVKPFLFHLEIFTENPRIILVGAFLKLFQTSRITWFWKMLEVIFNEIIDFFLQVNQNMTTDCQWFRLFYVILFSVIVWHTTIANKIAISCHILV